MIQLRDVHKYYGEFHALKGVTASIRQGEVLAVIGSSGSGKSTLIRTIGFLEKVQQGEVIVDALRYEIGFVFQAFNLFPHLTILENLVLAPTRVLHQARREAEAVATEFLKRVGISDQARKYPDQLSGGQQQRAAIARALCMRPKILLFDEPTSSLDPEMTAEVLDVIKEFAHSGITMVIVTHEMGFARQVSDRILFMNDGQILEEGLAAEFFKSPRHPRAQAFLAKTLRY